MILLTLWTLQREAKYGTSQPGVRCILLLLLLTAGSTLAQAIQFMLWKLQAAKRYGIIRLGVLWSLLQRLPITWCTLAQMTTTCMLSTLQTVTEYGTTQQVTR